MILAHLGLRKGEALGLSWKDLNKSRKTLSIVRQYTQDKTERAPKSKQSRRILAVDEALFAYLLEWKETQRSTLLFYSIEQTEETPIVHAIGLSQSNGAKHLVAKRVEGHNYSRWFRDFCVDNGFGRYDVIEKTFIRNGKEHFRGRHYHGLVPHALRHTAATLLIAAGTDVKTVQARMGHASPSTTLSIYAHAVEENDRIAAAAMDRILSPKDESEKNSNLV